MKYVKTSLMASLLAGVISVGAQAEESEARYSGFYLGAKVGQMMLDVDTIDDASTRGLVLGYDFGGFALEFERLEADLDWEYNAGWAGRVSGSLDYSSNALYGVYRSAGPVYFKAKAGVLKEEISDNHGSKDTDTGLSAGVGVGGRIGMVTIEAEFTILEQDANLLSIGAALNF